MKSLKIIQVLAKIGKIFSKVLFICCVVGFCGCVVGFFALLIGADKVKLDGKTLNEVLIEKANGTTVNTLYDIMVVGVILSAGQAVLCKFTEKYFDKQLAIGTPFDLEFSRLTLKTAILIICIPLVSILLASISHAIFKECLSGVKSMNLADYSSVGIGVAFILLSVIYRYGAEVIAQSKEKPVLPESDSKIEDEK